MFSAFQKSVPEVHWQFCIAFLAPLIPEFYDRVGKWKSVHLHQSLNLYSELEEKQMESFFRPLQGGILVYSNTTCYFTETLSEVYETLIQCLTLKKIPGVTKIGETFLFWSNCLKTTVKQLGSDHDTAVETQSEK